MGKYQSKEGFSNFGLQSKKDESRRLLKSCFKNPMFSLVPFEIWRELVVSNADLKTFVNLSQTCYAFKYLVENIGENNFNLALMLRREGQVDLAKKYLLLCANNNNTTAMFHVGYAHNFTGWGLKFDLSKAVQWYRKSADLGNSAAMALYAFCLKDGDYCEKRDEELGNEWGKKALSSSNPFAVGFCHFHSLGTEYDKVVAASFFEASAKAGDEIGQYFLGVCFKQGFGVEKSLKESFAWYLKSAEQGDYLSVLEISKMYEIGSGCDKNKKLSKMWDKKAFSQKKNIE